MPSSSGGGAERVLVEAHIDTQIDHQLLLSSSRMKLKEPYAVCGRPKRGSAKLQPSPSSVSSHSNNSSLFRDDGFEDDQSSSTASEHQFAYHQHHRLSFQGRAKQGTRPGGYLVSQHLSRHRSTSGCANEEDDEYQSCEELATTTTASTTSNFDDCALSTASSSIINSGSNSSNSNDHHQQIIDKISLANAKQLYRRSLLLEHHQYQQQKQQQSNQQQQQSQQTGQSKIQALLVSSPPIICHHLAPNKNAKLSASSHDNISNSNNQIATAITPQGANNPISAACKHADRTVNIIGHMPTKNPGYWDSNLSITQRVVTEIIETERTYVDDLEQIVTGYICYLRNVLKQQKQQHQHQLQSAELIKNKRASQEQHQSPIQANDVTLANNRRSSDDDDKSMLVFDEDATSATNEVEDYEEVEQDELAIDDEISNDMNDVDKLCSDVKSLHCANSDGAIITACHIKKLFSNLEDIYKFNKDLLFRLEECYLNPSSVAECFVENSSGFEVYTHYCTMYPQVVSTLTELMGNQISAQLLKERQNELNQSLPLGAYLLKPVQRILKYHILFQSLIKHTNDDDTVDEKDRLLIGEAFSVMTSIACHINAMKKRHEHAIRVQEVQGLLCGWEGPDLTTLGELILEDTFKLCGRPKTSRHLFLFDNVLLITKMKRDGSLCYKGHIACSNLMLIENIEGQPLVFNTVPFDNPKALCAFQAKNLEKKRDWCIQVKEVIIKSFEVKIPVHVKDILMSLTNSNSADVCVKSSSETSRALRAPNYLERKRIKQDKRK